MAYEAAIAVEMGKLSIRDARRLVSLLKSLKLPVRLKKEKNGAEKIKAVLEKMEIDKKNNFLSYNERCVNVVILEGIGRTRLLSNKFYFLR